MHRLPDGRHLVDSYHCSRYNQNTGRLNARMFEDVFEELPWHLQEQSEQAMRERRIKWPEWKES